MSVLQKDFNRALARCVATGRTQIDVARELSVSAQYIRMLKAGISTPKLIHVLAMERLADMAEAGEL